MNIAIAKISDLDDLKTLVREYQEEADVFDVEDEQLDSHLTELLKTDKNSTVFLGRSASGAPVGFLIVYLTPSTMDTGRIPTLIDLYIRPPQREKGFGRQLFAYTIRWAKRNKYPRIVCTVENMNMAAQYMFEPYESYSAGWVHYSLDLAEVE